MTENSTNSWSLCIGRWNSLELRLHILLPLLGLFGLFVVVNGDLAETRMLAWGSLVLVSSIALQELLRVVAALRVGGHADTVVLGPVGGWTKLHLPFDPPAHIAAALAGPMTFFVLMVLAGCGLALAGDQHVLRLMNPCNPQINSFSSAPALLVIGQLAVWINCCLLLISLLPIEPCAGAELLRGILWPVVGRTTAATATSHVALGGAVFLALLTLILPVDVPNKLIPYWFPLSCISVFLLYGGFRSAQARRYDVGLAIDQFDSDDDDWLISEWIEEDCEAVLVETMPDKQQERIDHKRREREATEDARVDDILARLHDQGLGTLSEEDRAILKRASRRYRQRRSFEQDS